MKAPPARRLMQCVLLLLLLPPALDTDEPQPMPATETAKSSEPSIEPVPKPAPRSGTEQVYGGYRGTDQTRRLKPFNPKPLDLVRKPGTVPADHGRAIVLRLDSITLMESANVVRTIPFDGNREVSITEVAAAVADPGWLSQEGKLLTLRAALIQDTGTRLRIASPEVSEVRLASLPGVFLGGRTAIARIEGVAVSSWLPDQGVPDTNNGGGRPFILYEDGSRLDVIRSEISYLGNDRVTAYGLAWRQKGSTGSLVDSEVHHNFFGAYTHEAKDMVFRNNQFHHNDYYGLDPHDYSTGLVVEDNEVWANGSHGIIFSRGVTDSVVRRNYSHNNGGNGIMMDLGSDRNTIEANRVENNRKDGIVIQASSDMVVSGNLSRNNREGIRSTGASLRNRFVANRLIDNETGVEVYGGTAQAFFEANVIRGTEGIALLLDAPATKVVGGMVDGADVAVDVRATPATPAPAPATADAPASPEPPAAAPSSVSGLDIRGVGRGVVVQAGAVANLSGLTIQAEESGVMAKRDGVATVESSRIQAPQIVRGKGVEYSGDADLGPPVAAPRRPWTVLSGATFILAAAALHLISSLWGWFRYRGAHSMAT